MRVLKFGGTSVASPDAIRRVVDIVRTARGAGPVAVVVSAFGGVTNALIELEGAAARRDPDWAEHFEALCRRHRGAARELATQDGEDLRQRLDALLADLRDLLRGVFLLREVSPRAHDGIVSYGERLSSLVVAAALRAAGVDAEAFDTRGLVITDDAHGRARVDFETTYANLRSRFGGEGPVPVITGFVGSGPDGQTTTLGRGGSDYTAALLGAAVDAEAVELWTDVSGVMTADPRVVPDARVQPQLSYEELMELSHFGAKVVHPPSVHPTRSRGIPLLIKNTFAPEDAGTRVTVRGPKTVDSAGHGPVRGITSIHRVVLARLEGDGMVGVPGIAHRLFGSLARSGVSVILISQSSSEHTICFAVAAEDAEGAARAVGEEFVLELRLGMVEELVMEPGHTVVAAVGARMAHRPGISGKIFGVLGDHRVNVRAIAQGSSELNISFVVEERDEVTAVRAIHDAFFAQGGRRLDVALVGVGRVGSTLVEQLRDRRGALAEEGLDLRVVALGGRRHLALDPEGLDLDRWRELLEAA
ncbi:MAG: aspartate kinase, partial [Acidobacteriota bacterium]